MPPVPIEKCRVCRFYHDRQPKNGDNGTDFCDQLKDGQEGCIRFQRKTCPRWEVRRILGIKP